MKRQPPTFRRSSARSHRRGLFYLLPAALVAVAISGGCADSEGVSRSEGRELGDGFAEVETVSYEALDIPEDAPTVLFLGDSITAGLHLPPDQAFPAAAQRQAMDYGVPFHLVNAGQSGDTSRTALGRLDFVLKNSSPDLVVIEVGANDALRGQPLKEVEANLREIISTIHLTDAQVLLLGMDAPTNLGDYARKFAEIYTRVSAEHDVLLVPSFLDGVGGIPDMNLPDGLHPTPEGHERLAKNIVRPLASLLSTASPRIAPAAATPQGR